MEVETNTIKTEILIEWNENGSTARIKVTKLETVDNRDILMEEETENLDIEGEYQDHQAMKDAVEEEKSKRWQNQKL
jgi:hypothetical protein